MAERDIPAFNFDAGLSTFEMVTALSGPWIGMGMVRSGIDKISGSIEIRSPMARARHSASRFR